MEGVASVYSVRHICFISIIVLADTYDFCASTLGYEAELERACAASVAN